MATVEADTGGSRRDHVPTGRSSEWECLRSAIARAGRPEGAGPPLVLVGEAGIGKSVLWRAAVDEAAAQGLLVLQFAAVESERSLAYCGLSDLLAGVLADALPGLPDTQRRALEVALLLREPERQALDRRTVGTAVLALLAELARRQPVLVAVDDLQWLDPPSAAALAFALRRLPGVAAVGTARTPWQHREPVGWPLPPPQLLELRGLTSGAIHHVIAQQLGRSLSHAEARRIHGAARGNPLHALELARALPDRLPARWTADMLLPSAHLEDLVHTRLAGLPGDTVEALLLMAAAGRPTLELMRAVTGSVVLPLLAPAVRAGLVRITDGELRFAHPLYAAVCYRAASPQTRAEAHRRLAAHAADAEPRVRHLALAATAPDPALAAELDAAAVAARLRGAPDAAADLAQLAAELTPADREGDRARRTAAAARHLLEAGDADAAHLLLERALAATHDPADRCRLLLARSGLSYERSGVHQAREDAQAALRCAGGDPLLRAEAILVYTELAQTPIDDRQAMVGEALGLLRAHGGAPAHLMAKALRERALASYHSGAGMPRDLMAEAAVHEADLVPLPPVAWRSATILGECVKYLDDFAEAERLLTEAYAVAEQESDVASLAEIAGHRAELALWTGHWKSAAGLARDAVRHAESSGLGGRVALACYFAGLVAAHRGDVDDARSLLDRAAASAEAAVDDWALVLTRHARGQLELSLGELDRAAAELGPVHDYCSVTPLSEPRQWRYLPDHVEVLVRLGRTDAPADLVAPLERWAARSGGWAQVQYDRAAAWIDEATGDRGAAVARLTSALERLAGLPLPFERARVLLALGGIERRAGRRRAAREHLEAAAASFRALGAVVWAAAAEREAGSISGRRGGDLALTTAEQRVAELVARGATNREVAATLCVSASTVETHLTRVYAKLGVRSRTELATRLG